MELIYNFQKERGKNIETQKGKIYTSSYKKEKKKHYLRITINS